MRNSADQLAIRVPRSGGSARVQGWPLGDSALWTSPTPVAALAAVLAFDDEDGSLAAIDAVGRPVRIELRAGRILAEKGKFTLARSADGWATFGVSDKTVSRLTPTGEAWAVTFSSPPAALVPTADGAVLVIVEAPDGAHLYRARPPAARLADSATIPMGRFGAATSLGDRLYFVTADALVGIRARDLKLGPPIAIGAEPHAMVASPSGDRVFVLAGEARSITVVDRYRDVVERTIGLPAAASALRMDPFGRWLLARSAVGDSVWVVALGSMTLISTMMSAWRNDLPMVAADGTIATLRGADVVRWDPATGAERERYPGGASDFWYLFSWNGLRQPSRTADPVEFAASAADSAVIDSTIAPEPGQQQARADSDARARTAPRATTTRGYIVSFAALLSRASADSLARTITIEGERARVLATRQGETPVYRVVLGPYASRDEATRIGKAARRDYWVVEGAP